MDINKKFEQAVSFLYEENYHLATQIIKLGFPSLTEHRIPTAGISWDKQRKKINFLFNKNFAKNLTNEEFAFVLAHEAMHLINMHVFMFKEILEKSKKNTPDVLHKWNVAADCIANDSLVNLYEINKQDTLSDVSLIYGMDVIKMHTHDMTLQDVHDLLPESDNSSLAFDENWESFYINDHIDSEFAKKISSFIKQNTNNSHISDKEKGKIDKIKDNLKQIPSMAGVNLGDEDRAVDNLGVNTLYWDKLINITIKDKKTEDIWTRSNRRLASIYPRVILPSINFREQKKIFVAIDTSGSINKKALSLFIDIVKTAPKEFTITAITFDTRCYEYDILSDQHPRGGGGTNFQIIENYIQNNFKQYPEAIFVLTDGNGTNIKFQNPGNAKKWCWLLYGSCSTHCIKNMKHVKLINFLKRRK